LRRGKTNRKPAHPGVASALWRGAIVGRI